MSTVAFTRSNSFSFSEVKLPPSKAEEKKEHGAHDFASICIQQGVDEGYARLREQWTLGKHPFPSAIQTLVSNPNYLAAWSVGVGLNASTNAITDVQDRELTSMAFSMGVTCLTLLDGMTSYAGLQRYWHAQAALKSSLIDLARALTDQTLDAFQLADIKRKCANNIKAAMGMPGMPEVFTQILADGVFSLHAATQYFASVALLSQVHENADGLFDMLDESAKANAFSNARSVGDFNQLLKDMPSLKSGQTAQQLLERVDDQKENFTEQKSWLSENLGFGMAINCVSFVRSIFELMRFSTTRSTLVEKKNAIALGIEALKAKGIENLKKLPGVKVLTHLFHAARHRITSNTAALFGGFTRMGNGILGLLFKSLGLGGVAIGPAGAVLSTVVFAIYAIKSFVQRHFDRLAGWNENEVANAFKMAANISPEALTAGIAQELVQDLQELAGNMDNIQAFLEAMGHPELFEDFKTKFEKAANEKEKLALLKSLIDDCMPTADGGLKKQMLVSKDGRIQLLGHTLPDPPAAPKKRRLQHPKALARSSGATWEEKLFRNLPDKAIASLSGSYPGLHMRMGYSKQLSIEAEKHVTWLYGDTPATRQLITISQALDANKAFVKNRSFFHAFLKGRTWELSPEGNNIQQALESGNTHALNAKTLAEALSKSDHDLNNHHTIAGCRFDAMSQAKDHSHLASRLESIRKSKGHEHLKAIIEAMDTCKGRPLLELACKMQRTESGKEQFKLLFETACMLSGRSLESGALVYSTLFEGRDLASVSRDDLSNALAIVTGQQLHARIADPQLNESLQGFLTVEGRSFAISGDMVFVKSGPDARWDLFANDVIAGKSRLEDAPDWLLHKEFKTLLKGKKLSKACQDGLREQLQIGLGHKPKSPQPFSLLWPSNVLGDKTALEGLWRRSFTALTGIDTQKSTWADLKAAAALYVRCNKCEFGLSDLEKLIKAHKKDQSPEQRLTIKLALQWTTAPWSVQIDDKKTVETLMATRSSKDFISVLKSKLNPPSTAASTDKGVAGISTEDTAQPEDEHLRKKRKEEQTAFIRGLNLNFKEPLFDTPEIHTTESVKEAEIRLEKDLEPKRRNSMHIPGNTRERLLADGDVISNAKNRPRLPTRFRGDMPLDEPHTEKPALHPDEFNEQQLQRRLLGRVATA